MLSPLSNQTQIPVTIVSGFLGSGKTTLINYVLQELGERRVAVIENEFSEAGIDGDLLANAEGQIVEINNGCICCTVGSDLVRILGQLAVSREQGLVNFERVIVETTGLANPSAVAQAFVTEPAVGRNYFIDAIVTVLDARHATAQLEYHAEARAQVQFADHILISKADLTAAAHTAMLMQRLRALNTRASTQIADFGKTELGTILDVKSFDLHAMLTIAPDFLDHIGHPHDDAVASFIYRSRRPFAFDRLERFLGSVCRVYGDKVWRSKGIIHVDGEESQIVFQGVHAVTETQHGRPWGPAEKRESTLVFIGTALPRELLTAGLDQCHADADAVFKL